MKKILFLSLIFSISFFALFSWGSVAKKNSQTKYEDLVKELEGIKDAKTDLQFYSEIVSDYQSGKYRNLTIRLNSFQKKYPQSFYLDNAYYLAGKLAMEQKNYLESLKNFQKIISLFPLSNKVVSAKFGKAMAYKRMNLETQATEVFKEIRNKYPNSPEYYRAETEMKLIK